MKDYENFMTYRTKREQGLLYRKESPNVQRLVSFGEKLSLSLELRARRTLIGSKGHAGVLFMKDTHGARVLSEIKIEGFVDISSRF